MHINNARLKRLYVGVDFQGKDFIMCSRLSGRSLLLLCNMKGFFIE